MADINQQERDEFQALIRGYGQGPRSFTANAGVQSDPVRSEERRVGKECRSRWSPYH